MNEYNRFSGDYRSLTRGEVVNVLHETQDERDSLRAQLAEAVALLINCERQSEFVLTDVRAFLARFDGKEGAR